MTATKLTTRRVEKPWGRHTLWPGFDNPASDDKPVGEIWFQMPDESDDGDGDASKPDLLIKYLFPGEKLSVQVHPNDQQAHARGLPRGKDEYWVVLDAEPDSTIAIGTRAPMSKDALRTAARDGSIEQDLDWKTVKAGDFYYAPADTIHAIGGGITVIEVQQNSDTTYRLYDYGSDRELHLDDGVEVADANPYVAPSAPGRVADDRILLVEGPKFVLERWPGGNRAVSLPTGVPAWFVPITGEGQVDGVAWKAGECLLVKGDATISASEDSDLLFAYPGDTRI